MSLALTDDLVHFERCGLAMQADDKDAALLPRRVESMYALIDRPIADSYCARQGQHPRELAWLDEHDGAV